MDAIVFLAFYASAVYAIGGVARVIIDLLRGPVRDMYFCGLVFALGYHIVRIVINSLFAPSRMTTYFDQWPEGVLTNSIICVVGVSWCVWDGKRGGRKGSQSSVIASRAGIVLSILPLYCGVFMPVM